MKRSLIAVATVAPVLVGLGTVAPASAAPGDVQLCAPDVNGGTLVNGVCVLPSLHVGQEAEEFLINSGGGVDAWAVTSGAIPTGLDLPSVFGAGATIIAGTPAQQGTFTFTVENAPATEPGSPSELQYRITVGPPVPLTVTLPGSGSTLSPGAVGTPYAENFFVGGGVAPYTWSVVGGQLPNGLGLVTTDAPDDTNNQLAGTPTQAGTFTFTMQVSDGDGNSATQQFSLTITG